MIFMYIIRKKKKKTISLPYCTFCMSEIVNKNNKHVHVMQDMSNLLSLIQCNSYASKCQD